MILNKNEIVFYIDNLAYSFEVSSALEKELLQFLEKDKNHSTKELLTAYVLKSNELLALKKDLEAISEKLPPIK